MIEIIVVGVIASGLAALLVRRTRWRTALGAVAIASGVTILVARPTPVPFDEAAHQAGRSYLELCRQAGWYVRDVGALAGQPLVNEEAKWQWMGTHSLLRDIAAVCLSSEASCHDLITSVDLLNPADTERLSQAFSQRSTCN